VTTWIILLACYLSERSCLAIDTIIVFQSATMMKYNQIFSPLSSVFYRAIRILVTMVKNIAGSKQRHKEIVSQVAFPTMGSDITVITGMKLRHSETVFQVALSKINNDTKVITGSKRRHSETVYSVALPKMSSDAKDISVNVRLFDRLALRNIHNPIIGVNLSYDTSYSFEGWRMLVKELLKVFGKIT